ncbi:MAG: DUF2891 domain-containing protein [Acidobacteria bacterium]|nr:DUF2891 domain-containing protein [Acidobacteriota bacterium]
MFAVLLLAQMLTPEIASRLAELPLHCIRQEYPNKTGHTTESDGDARLTPRQLHPAFYGCLDWHSSVHGHWMLVRLLKTTKGLSKEAEIRKVLAESFTPEAIAGEVRYFEGYKLAKTFERTYGWAWLLKLDEELRGWDDPQGRVWAENLRPLTKLVVGLWAGYLPKQTYPNRTGVHPNTAFGLVFALDWARAVKDTSFEALIVQRMRRVLPAGEFARWFNRFMPAAGLLNLTQPPVVSDRSDFQIVHLDGLYLSRGWCLYGIAQALPQGSARRRSMMTAAKGLIDAALPNVTGGNYGGEHWLASFAVYALSQAPR